MSTIMTCEPSCTAQHPWTFPMSSVYGRSSNLCSDKTSDNSVTEETIIFFLRDTQRSVQQPYSLSSKGDHTICRNQLRGNFHQRLHIDANGAAPEEMKHKL